MFIAGRRTAPLEAAKAEIEAIGVEADYAVIDVTDPKSVQAGVDAAIKRFGKIDIVVANAGGNNISASKLLPRSSMRLFVTDVISNPRRARRIHCGGVVVYRRS